jgi:MinD-like ATPase involved in chromosome partitioning or flagellar assembly
MAASNQRVRLALLSPKGGCGRSTAAINLAYLLAATGRKVALVDLAQFGSLALLLQTPQSPGAGLGPVAACLASVHWEELPAVLETALQPCRLGHHPAALLPAAAPQRQDDLPVSDLLTLLETLSDLGYDLVLDTSHEFSDRLAAALLSATHRLWLLTPDPAAGWHALQAREIARELGAPEVPEGILVNRYHRRCGLRLPDLAAATGLPVWGALPDLPGRLPLAAHVGIPIVAHRFGRWRTELHGLLSRLGIIDPAPWWTHLRSKETIHGQV